MPQHLALHGDKVPGDALVRSYSAEEGVSLPYAVTVEISTSDTAFRVHDCLQHRTLLERVNLRSGKDRATTAWFSAVNRTRLTLTRRKIVRTESDEGKPTLSQVARLASTNVERSVVDILREFERVAGQRGARLDLRGKGLTELPEEIGLLDGVAEIDLSGNFLKTLPWSFALLRQLRVLNLTGNDLTWLPEDLCGLTELTSLKVGWNAIKEVSPAISGLTHLEVLHLGSNKLERLRSELFDLTSLRWLNVSGNRLKSLHPNVGKLKELRYLEIFDNPFTLLPDEVWTLPKLEWICVDVDQWQRLPEAIRDRKRGTPEVRVA